MTNRLAATNFSVLAAKRLVVSKKFTSQTPVQIQFWSRVQNFDSIFAKLTPNWYPRQNLGIIAPKKS